MRIFQYQTIVGLVLLLGPSGAIARTVYFGSETEMISLAPNGSTLLKFPSDVRTISQAQRFEIQPADSEQPNYALLSVRPRFSSGTNNVVFILNDGTIIRTKLVVISGNNPERTEAIYEFKSKDSLVANSSDPQTASGVSELDLMKAMIRGDDIAGYQLKKVSHTVSPGFKGVSTTLVEIYTGNQFNGYVFEVENRTKDKLLAVNIQNLMLGDPNQALLSNVDSQVIEPQKSGKNKTTLRIVAKPTSTYSKLILPIETVQKNGDAKP
jgi:hypothetical protein